MACLNMQVKNETQAAGSSFMGPRISFSNDFINHNEIINTYTEAPVSSDFEFSVPTFSSNSADNEVFFKAGGKLPPLKEKVVTLRDELLSAHDDDDDDDEDDGTNMFFNNKNSTGWWRERFGLRKSQNGKSEHKNLRGLETIDETKIKPAFYTPNFTGSNRYK